MQLNEDNQNEWRQLIDKQKESGLSKVAFCKLKGIKPEKFYYYADTLTRQKHKKVNTPSEFVPVEVKKWEHHLNCVNSREVFSEKLLFNYFSICLPLMHRKKYTNLLTGKLKYLSYAHGNGTFKYAATRNNERRANRACFDTPIRK